MANRTVKGRDTFDYLLSARVNSRGFDAGLGAELDGV